MNLKTTDFKKIRRAKHEYMNIPPPPPPINALVSPLSTVLKLRDHQLDFVMQGKKRYE